MRAVREPAAGDAADPAKSEHHAPGGPNFSLDRLSRNGLLELIAEHFPFRETVLDGSTTRTSNGPIQEIRKPERLK